MSVSSSIGKPQAASIESFSAVVRTIPAGGRSVFRKNFHSILWLGNHSPDLASCDLHLFGPLKEARRIDPSAFSLFLYFCKSKNETIGILVIAGFKVEPDANLSSSRSVNKRSYLPWLASIAVCKPESDNCWGNILSYGRTWQGISRYLSNVRCRWQKFTKSILFNGPCYTGLFGVPYYWDGLRPVTDCWAVNYGNSSDLYSIPGSLTTSIWNPTNSKSLYSCSFREFC